MEKFDQARTYAEKQSTNQFEDGLRLINLLAPGKGDSVLDLGCGTGSLTKVLASRVEKVIGIDPDVSRLNIAKVEYSTANTTYMVGKGESISAREEYDVVFSNYVLHWVKDKNLVLRNVAKSLKRGGKFAFISTANFGSFNLMKQWYTPAEMFSAEFTEHIHNNLHVTSLPVYEKAASANGFEIVHLEKQDREFNFSNLHGLIEFHMTHNKCGKEHFDVEAMKKVYGEGEITLHNPLIFVIAQKT